jgi:integrase
MADRLVEAGLTLITEADFYLDASIKRALGIRNGLMLALLALCPIRAKSFAELEIGTTFRQVSGRWWISLPGRTTKMRKPEERPVADWMNPYIELYLTEATTVLLGRSRQNGRALWLSSRTNGPMTPADLGSLISRITLKTIGVNVSPRMFRTSCATTVADSAGDRPHLASALLAHSDPRITEEHYNRASSLNVANEYAEIIARRYRPQRIAANFRKCLA